MEALALKQVIIFTHVCGLRSNVTLALLLGGARGHDEMRYGKHRS